MFVFYYIFINVSGLGIEFKINVGKWHIKIENVVETGDFYIKRCWNECFVKELLVSI